MKRARDPSGQILNEHGASGTRHYLGDYQSSVTAMVGTTGTLMATYAYEPYGKATVNAQSGGTTAADNPWRYTGGYYDTEGDGNYHLGARYYDGAGHFTQADSIQGNIEDPKTVNSYGYAGADPLNHVDPTGRSTQSCIFAVGLIAVSSVGLAASLASVPLTGGLSTPEAIALGATVIGKYGGLLTIGYSCP